MHACTWARGCPWVMQASLDDSSCCPGSPLGQVADAGGMAQGADGPAMHTQVATPVQAARADQLCYPHLPDVLAMCAALTGSGSSGNSTRPAAPPAKRPKVEPSSAAPEGIATRCLPWRWPVNQPMDCPCISVWMLCCKAAGCGGSSWHALAETDCLDAAPQGAPCSYPTLTLCWTQRCSTMARRGCMGPSCGAHASLLVFWTGHIKWQD